MSAAGYTDATDWKYCESLYELIDYLQDECAQVDLDVDELPEYKNYSRLTSDEKSNS